jgi:hypothetical protein
MKVLIISINHGQQTVPLRDEVVMPEVAGTKDQLKSLVKDLIASRAVDLICEESDPCRLSIAQEEAFKNDPRILWKNINMTAQQRLEAGIWEPLLYRPFEMNEHMPVAIEHRVAEDDIREEFFKDEILKAAQESGANSILVVCGDMHTEPIKAKLVAAGYQVETNHDLISEKHWK